MAHSTKKKTTRNAKGGKPWTTDMQRTWLTTYLGLYEEAQHSKIHGTVKTFRWGRLHDWFNNHKRDLGLTRVTKVLDFRAHKKRHLSGCEAYYHLYYDDVLRPTVQQRWAQSPDYDTKTPEAPFEFHSALIQQLWKLEKDKSPIKEQVTVYIEKEYERMNSGATNANIENIDPGEDEEDLDPEELK
ncbi:hypothetical protein BDN71DRAFT_1430022 [Pleurotus eryngii]|uniref:Uncharacterized protein n=1 Tax=Pleurotus eryngii TaxID=5323 RepID=A0A9P6A160_PLEER|nr:hypothetical protein BDN71DRAFT_1430022 [Pleurotus eryngii]